MRADDDGRALGAWHRYDQCNWGDCIEGTKEQLQALGLGIGLAFPGEVGGPGRHWTLRVRDPRGYEATIRKSSCAEATYFASLHFPGWPEMPKPKWTPFTDGVKKREYTWFDEYVGGAEALADAGLVHVDQLPGKPGMRKVRVTVLPDGTLPTGAHTANHRAARVPGARWIERASASSYRVNVVVTEDERRRRQAAEEVAESAWLRRVRALPRPARLQPMAQARWTSLEAARASAARDVVFQGMLARLVAGARRPSA